MNWLIEILFFAIIMTFIWTYLFRKYGKTGFCKYFIGANFIIFLFYTLALLRTFFIPELGKGGGSFAAGFYLLLITPIHVGLAFISTLIFKKSEFSVTINKLLLTIGLPFAMLILGYLISDKRHEMLEKKNQLFHQELNEKMEKDEIEHSQSIGQFQDFLVKFSTDTIFQKANTKLPLPIFYLNSLLSVDTVSHYYKHDWKPFKFELDNLTQIYNDWDYLNKKSSNWTLSRPEQEYIVDYNFGFDEGWQLIEVKKRKNNVH